MFLIFVLALISSCTNQPSDLDSELQRRWDQDGLGLAQLRGRGNYAELVAMPALPTNTRWNRRYEVGYLIGRFSPDGKQVLGYARDLGSKQRELRLFTVEGETVAQFAGDFANINSLAVSHDGQSAAFDGDYRQPGRENARERVFGIVTLGSTGITTLAKGSYAWGHSPRVSKSDDMGWAPDGRELVFEQDRKILVFDLGTGQKREIGTGSNPTWSPDGRWIAFVDPSSRATLVRPNGSERRLPLGEQAVLAGLHWSPDSLYFVYSVRETGSLQAILSLSSTALYVCRVSDGMTTLAGRLMDGGTNRDWGWVVLPGAAVRAKQN